MQSRILAVAFAMLLASPAVAQSGFPTVWLEAGGSEFDLAGTGTATVLGARSDLELNRYLVVEAGVGYTRTAQTFSDISYLVPDVEVQVQLPLGRVRPYLGLGAGALIVLGESQRPRPNGSVALTPDGYDTGTVTLSTGARVGINDAVSARVGTRLRGTVAGGPDFFGSTITELTLGVGYRF